MLKAAALSVASLKSSFDLKYLAEMYRKCVQFVWLRTISKSGGSHHLSRTLYQA